MLIATFRLPYSWSSFFFKRCENPVKSTNVWKVEILRRIWGGLKYQAKNVWNILNASLPVVRRCWKRLARKQTSFLSRLQTVCLCTSHNFCCHVHTHQFACKFWLAVSRRLQRQEQADKALVTGLWWTTYLASAVNKVHWNTHSTGMIIRLPHQNRQNLWTGSENTSHMKATITTRPTLGARGFSCAVSAWFRSKSLSVLLLLSVRVKSVF